MIVYTTTLSDLEAVVPNEVAAFRAIISPHNISDSTAIKTLAHGDSEHLMDDSHDITVEVASNIHASLDKAFRDISDAFAANTKTPHCPPLALEAQDNDDESEGYGPYIRILHAFIRNPALESITHHIATHDLTVFKSEADWRAERLVSGV